MKFIDTFTNIDGEVFNGQILDEEEENGQNILTIYGYNNSTAQEYVNGKKINFISLGNIPNKNTFSINNDIKLNAKPNSNGDFIATVTEEQINSIINNVNTIDISVSTATYANSITVKFSVNSINAICNNSNIDGININTDIYNIQNLYND